MSLLQTPWTQQPQQAVGIDTGNAFGSKCDFAWLPTATSVSVAKLTGQAGIAADFSARKAAGKSDAVKNRPFTVVLVVAFPTASLSSSTQPIYVGSGNGFRLDAWTTGGGVYAGWTANGVSNGATPVLDSSGVFNSRKVVIVSDWTPTGQTTWCKKDGLPLVSWSDTFGYNSPTDTTINLGDSAGVNAAKIYGCYILRGNVGDSGARNLIENPWQIFRPIPRRIFVPVVAGGSDPTGSLNYTNNPQTLTASGGVGVGASASLSQVAQVLNGVGAVAIGATASINEAADTLSASGTVVNGVVATASITQSPQTVTSSGSVAIGATSSTTQAAQTVSASATVTGGSVTGTANISTGAQTAASSGLIAITGAANLASVAQTLTASGIALSPVTGTANITPSAQTLNAVGGAFVPLTDSEKIDLILDILSNRQTLDPVTGLYTLYADDGVTVLKTALAWEDADGTQPYRGQALQRLDALE